MNFLSGFGDSPDPDSAPVWAAQEILPVLGNLFVVLRMATGRTSKVAAKADLCVKAAFIPRARRQ
jgi:predicted secreted protein